MNNYEFAVIVFFLAAILCSMIILVDIFKRVYGEPLPADFFPQKIVEDYQTEYKGKIYYPMGVMVSQPALYVTLAIVGTFICVIVYYGVKVARNGNKGC